MYQPPLALLRNHRRLFVQVLLVAVGSLRVGLVVFLNGPSDFLPCLPLLLSHLYATLDPLAMVLQELLSPPPQHQLLFSQDLSILNI